jgi:hypothetical protein
MSARSRKAALTACAPNRTLHTRLLPHAASHGQRRHQIRNNVPPVIEADAWENSEMMGISGPRVTFSAGRVGRENRDRRSAELKPRRKK